MSEQTSALLLVEDDASLGATLQERLQKEGYQVVWSQSLEAAQNVFSAQSFDLIILDVGLPDGSGFNFARQVRKQSETPFIFVTAMASAPHRLEGFEIGAEEYIPKPFHLKEILLRIRHVLENHAPKKHIRTGEFVVDFERMAVLDSQGKAENLSKKDFELLRLLIRRAPNVVSRDEILNQVWGEENFPTNRTIDNVIVRLRSILRDDGTRYIRSVRGVGYQWSAPVEVHNAGK
jgi:two-component system phosphate regulon response regulator PhoB